MNASSIGPWSPWRFCSGPSSGVPANDGVHEVAARYQAIDQRMARGLINRVHRAQKKHQDDDMPEPDTVEINQPPE